MNIGNLISKTRSYRRFEESHHIELKTMMNLVDLARLSASASNKQPLKYMIYNSPEDCEKIFPSTVWAGYLKNWSGPKKGERPSGYVIILGDKQITEFFGVDHGIAAQSIMLGATEVGLGGCMIGSLKLKELYSDMNIPSKFEILLVLALGKPVEKVIVEDIKEDNVKYWRDSEENHHVPKRKLEDLIINL